MSIANFHNFYNTLYWLVSVLFLQSCHEVVVVLDELPANTPQNASLYLAGNFNDWDPGDPRYRFEKGADNRWTLRLPKAIGELQCKVSRGDWTTVEANPCGHSIDNHAFRYGSADTVYLRVASWSDLEPTTCGSVTILVDDLPANTPLNQNLYLSGAFNSWDPGDERFRLKRDSSGRHSITLRQDHGQAIEFKFTRGNWPTVEVDRFGHQISNRRFVFGQDDTLRVKIENWEDLAEPQNNRVTIILRRIPPNTPKTDKIFLTGDFNGWYPRDINTSMAPDRDGNFSITLPKNKNEIAYLFCRGSAESLEAGLDGNRRLARVCDFSHDTVWVEIDSWVDMPILQDNK